MEQDNMNSKRILNTMGFALFLMAAVVLIVPYVIIYTVKATIPEIADANWFGWALTASTVVGIALPVFYFATKNIPDSPHGEVVKLRFPQLVVLFFICTATMYITNFFGTIVSFFISMVKGDDIVNPLTEVILGSNMLITFLYGCIVAPVVEELIFRKLLLNKVRRFGDLPAMLISGVAFGLFHMNILQFFYATALGIIFAYIAIKTNTVKYSILLHIIINTIGISLAPFALQGGSLNFGVLLFIIIWAFTAIAVGVLFFVLNIKKIKLDKAEEPIERKSNYFLNVGAILFILICLEEMIKLILY